MRPHAALPLLALLIAAPAAHATLGKTTLEERLIGGDKSQGYAPLTAGPGEGFKVREELGVKALDGRDRRRKTVSYFAQLSDFQLADEESPARVEFTDQFNSFFSSAFRPQEALMPWVIDHSIRQVNAHAKSGPVSKAKLDYSILTGDNADNAQANEVDWVVRLLQGGRLDPNSGSPNAEDYAGCSPGTPGVDEAARYTGVQDYDDYPEQGTFYDPDQPAGIYAKFPQHPGLMDRAQQPFDTPGLTVPSYVAVGNHDTLVQGNEDANAAFERVAVGCTKPMGASFSATGLDTGLLFSQALTSPDKIANVPPDPRRHFITKPEYRQAFAGGKDAHGFAFVEKAELDASRNSATYYAFSPVKGIRMVALDTVSEGGIAGPSADGNVDDPQYKWLERTLDTAQKAGELVIVFSHHGPTSLTADVPDEAATQCTSPDAPADDPNPGCDLDPRASTPLHLGEDMVALLHRFPSVVAWVAGHSHVNDVLPYPKQGGGGFWLIRTSAESDFPHQDRLIEIMDNRDGTLSLFGTLIDNAAPAQAPAAGTPGSAMSGEQLASLARVLGYNDPDVDGTGGSGDPEDHNVELLVADPRPAGTQTRAGGAVTGRLKVTVSPRRLVAGRRTRMTVTVTRGGRPVKALRVRVLGRRARTSARGRAKLTVVARRAGIVKIRVAGKTVRVRVVRRG